MAACMGWAVLDWKHRCPAKVRFCHSVFVSFPAGAIFRIAGTASDWILEKSNTGREACGTGKLGGMKSSRICLLALTMGCVEQKITAQHAFTWQEIRDKF